MIIAISQRNDKNKHGDYVDSLENNYMTYFERLGVKLLPIPNSVIDIRHYFEEFHILGVILSGGNDVDPEIYGEKNREEYSVSKNRDFTEKRMLEIAIEKKLPVLGICRGMQFINVFFDGKLINIKEAIKTNNEHVAVSHKISITEPNVTKMLGKTVDVNSYHNQGLRIDELSPKLKVFAQTSNGIIEGIYHPLLPIAGIQWHPERESPDEEFNKKITQAFIEKRLFWKK